MKQKINRRSMVLFFMLFYFGYHETEKTQINLGFDDWIE